MLYPVYHSSSWNEFKPDNPSFLLLDMFLYITEVLSQTNWSESLHESLNKTYLTNFMNVCGNKLNFYIMNKTVVFRMNYYFVLLKRQFDEAIFILKLHKVQFSCFEQKNICQSVSVFSTFFIKTCLSERNEQRFYHLLLFTTTILFVHLMNKEAFKDCLQKLEKC